MDTGKVGGFDNVDNGQRILYLATKVGERLRQHGLLMVSAESCTGGWLGQIITAIAGSSVWYERGFITYSDLSKHEMLGVSMTALNKYGAVSEVIAQEMAFGAQNNSPAHISVAITGIAGPTGGNKVKPIGTVCFAWAVKGGLSKSETCHFEGDRESVRQQSVAKALQGLLDLLDEISVVVV
ncbi:CinA family protein [Nitrosomonas aestuarii]|uniref:CinA family protein n=1 Tax=Nitrosomonas aestuarii TaxID=52441 RepID=UPI000D30AEA9|nr:nicotinamide-nucleotide amidohydrolase family protein [Nitrosomonas aestuarii]PTN12905.1 nicotinamide-nucleotide amidase [Nitrosomonas aestuarii]